ncbi:cyclin domain fused to cyclin-dependent serine/threonine protein kinase [Acanthamoeba polyphaga moumouvirus]|uniref:cyclin-dependent kinase n=1 Tax=Acanthamoeba polyphaga moumouvirus TaxID=1269028 RepID=L7RBX8_9VIRU|nr:cyclin domain fused to cyclin-dependent serine/threonine protein kinase [Acanthamoeba polyphaga moumouvirus]AGC01671.1 cyclin domain fused to cyclin-dependent serine/threonine protein kinase [Acanthamoeba polyphaga moumouvirus]AQN68007.1 cyclin domain fused to cyclin-dependent serine/threonine protein kinase [Saudi moumouvirus]
MNYFEKHISLTENMRVILLDWLMEVTIEYDCSHTCYNLSVVLLDEFLCHSNDIIEKKYLQAVGISCLNIASKITDTLSPHIDEFCYISANTYSVDTLNSWELKILETFNFQLYRNTATHYIKLICFENEINMEDYYLARFIIAISLMNIDYACFDQEFLAKSSLLLSQAINHKPDTVEELVHSDKIYYYLFYQIIKYPLDKYDGIKSFADIYKISEEKIKSIKSLVKSDLIYTRDSYPKYVLNLNPIIKYSENSFKELQHIKRLGRGSYGIVDHIVIDNKNLALKTITSDNGEITQTMLRELNNLCYMENENIVKIYGYYYNSSGLYIGMELMFGSLMDKLENNKLSDATKFNYIMQLLNGLKYMHEKKIIHRDLSCNNVLISNNDILKISDFGCSRQFIHSKSTNNFSEGVCSLWYRPIDIVLGKYPYNEKMDIWSCGCIIGAILRGDHLFKSNHETSFMHDVFKILGTPTENYYPQVILWPNFPKNISIYPRKGFTDLDEKYPNQTKIIYKMLSYDPDERPDIGEIYNMFVKSFSLQEN